MTHYDAILNHIKADAPCSLTHVTNWATYQGFGGTEMVRTIKQLTTDGWISLQADEDNIVTVELLKD